MIAADWPVFAAVKRVFDALQLVEKGWRRRHFGEFFGYARRRPGTGWASG